MRRYSFFILKEIKKNCVKTALFLRLRQGQGCFDTAPGYNFINAYPLNPIISRKIGRAHV